MRLTERRRSASFGATLGLCALSGAMLALCFPPAGLWFLAWVALVPWLVALRTGSGWGAVIGSWVGGFVFFGILLYWLGLFGVSVWAIACLLLAVALMLWGVLVRWTGRLGPALRVLGAAVLWCGVEWGRGLGQFGFTWGWLGYSQSPALAMLPVARVAGTLGLSFLIVLVNAVAAEAVAGLRRGESAPGWGTRVVAVVGVAALCVLGARSWADGRGGPSGPRVRVAIAQGSAHGELRAEDVNVPLTAEESKRALDIYVALTLEAAGDRPVLVVWPESVLPGIPYEEPQVAERVGDAARKLGAWLVAGGPYRDERGRPRNSAYLFSATGTLRDRYDKVQLVPFGEYVPGRTWLPFLDRYNVRDEDFAPGTMHRVMQAETTALGPMICFESIFPSISWQLVERGAQVLVIITNDAWFGRTAAAEQHRQIAVLRAVESNRWVIRGASTGISSIIAPNGRVVAEAGLFDRDWISADIVLANRDDGAVAWGPLFSWSVFCLSFAFIIAPLGARGGRRGSGRAGASGASRPAPAPRPRGRAAPR